jgi:hypothetical protein
MEPKHLNGYAIRVQFDGQSVVIFTRTKSGLKTAFHHLVIPSKPDARKVQKVTIRPSEKHGGKRTTQH